MGNLIMLNTWQRKEKKRGNLMYENLLENLRQNPANNYNIYQAERLADEILEIGGYADLVGAVPVVKIAKDFGISTFRDYNIKEEISGNIFIHGTTQDVYGTDKAIIVDAKDEFFHQRFIVAHELAHYLMDFWGNDDYEDTKKLFSEAYLKNKHDSPKEVRADRFAAELLMPSKIFLTHYIKAMSLSENNITYTITYLSKLFGTKQSSIKKRMKELTI